LSAFSASPTSTLARSTTRYKDGTHSMKWTWTSGDEIIHDLSSDVSKYLKSLTDVFKDLSLLRQILLAPLEICV